MGGCSTFGPARRTVGPTSVSGTGAAMRISPVGYTYETLEKTLRKAEDYTIVTHNHPECTKGAQATAMAIFLARTRSTKEKIRENIEGTERVQRERPDDPAHDRAGAGGWRETGRCDGSPGDPGQGRQRRGGPIDRPFQNDRLQRAGMPEAGKSL